MSPFHSNDAARTSDRKRVDLAEKGWMAVIAGLALMFVMPGFIQGPVAETVRPAMRAVGGIVLFLGVVLLVVHVVVKRRATSSRHMGAWHRGSDPQFNEDAPSQFAQTIMVSPQEPGRFSSGAINQSSWLRRLRGVALPGADNSLPSSAAPIQPMQTLETLKRRGVTSTATPKDPTARGSSDWANWRGAKSIRAKADIHVGAALPSAATGAGIPPRPALACGLTASTLQSITGPQFEALCEVFFAQVGVATLDRSHGPTGGVVFRMQSRNSPAIRIVECRHGKLEPVEEDVLLQFLEAMAAQQQSQGTYVTSSTFTLDAGIFARANGITLLDGATLLRQIGKRSDTQQAALMDVVRTVGI